MPGIFRPPFNAPPGPQWIPTAPAAGATLGQGRGHVRLTSRATGRAQTTGTARLRLRSRSVGIARASGTVRLRLRSIAKGGVTPQAGQARGRIKLRSRAIGQPHGQDHIEVPPTLTFDRYRKRHLPGKAQAPEQGSRRSTSIHRPSPRSSPTSVPSRRAGTRQGHRPHPPQGSSLWQADRCRYGQTQAPQPRCWWCHAPDRSGARQDPPLQPRYRQAPSLRCVKGPPSLQELRNRLHDRPRSRSPQAALQGHRRRWRRPWTGSRQIAAPVESRRSSRRQSDQPHQAQVTLYRHRSGHIPGPDQGQI